MSDVQEALRMAREAKSCAERATADVTQMQTVIRDQNGTFMAITTGLNEIKIEQARQATDMKWIRERLAERVTAVEGAATKEKGAKAVGTNAQLIGIIAVLVAIIAGVLGVTMGPTGGP